MLITNFSDNRLGKLLPDVLTTVRLHEGKYTPGAITEIQLSTNPIGVGKVMSVIQFKLKDMPDCIAFMDCGGNAEYLKAMLYKFYSNIHEETVFDVVTIKWTVRYALPHQQTFTKYWGRIIRNWTNKKELQFTY